ncbi:MAG TPA: tetratricopeptide repeat protein [Steroidobacteraceae bacterium]|nr:tetratricopeptide repeat protein [Steroidobacteraceae bacterium]HXI78962.1 tetratricopeptide repeat protein [Steroidobacteraceae bacterium]
MQQPKHPRAKPLDDEMHAYNTKDLERLFGLPASAVRSLTRAGHISPVKRAGRLHYSFQDLLMLRTASALRSAKISAHRINRTLQTLRATLPTNQRSLTALGDQIAVREGKLLWESDSGQYVLALDIGEEKGGLHVIPRQTAAVQTADSADEHFAKGLALEDTDPDGARAGYEACLAADPQHMDARINLGRLLHMAGRLADAERVYRSAKKPESVLLFNLAVLLEDLAREPDAIVAYREALALDPELADAHFNLARLYERARNPKSSLRHLLAYRRMIDRQGT